MQITLLSDIHKLFGDIGVIPSITKWKPQTLWVYYICSLVVYPFALGCFMTTMPNSNWRDRHVYAKNVRGINVLHKWSSFRNKSMVVLVTLFSLKRPSVLLLMNPLLEVLS